MGMEPNIEEHTWKLQIDRPHVSRPRLQKSVVLEETGQKTNKAMLRVQKKRNPPSDESLLLQQSICVTECQESLK